MNGGGATERLRITSTGILGFNGNSAPGNAGLDKMSMGYLNGNYGWIQTWNGTPLILNREGNNVGINTSTPFSSLDVATSSTGAICVGNSSSTISNGDLIGAISFVSRDASTFSSGGVANIRSYAAATYNSSLVTADLRFYTTNGVQNIGADVLFGSERMRITSGGDIGIGTTSPQAGVQIEKYGSKFDGDVQYNQPTGNVFLSVTGTVANQDNWFGIRGNYGSSSGSSNLLLQANYRDVNSQAGHYISSKATALGVADFIIGKLVTSTSVSTPPTLVPQLYITSGGNVGIGTTTPNVRLRVEGSTILNGAVSANTTYNAFALNVGGIAYIIGGSVWVNDAYGYTNASSVNTGMYPDSSHNITFKNNNSTSVYITSIGRVGIGTTNPYGPLHVVGGTTIHNGPQTFSRVQLVFGQVGTFTQVKVVFDKTNWGSVTYDIKLASAGGTYHTAGAYYSNPGFSNDLVSISVGSGISVSKVATSPTGGTQGATWTFSGATMIHPIVTVDLACGNGFQVSPDSITVEFS